MEFFVSPVAMVAADGGISPSMAQSAQLQKPLMESFTWKTEARRIYTGYVKLKASVRRSTKAGCVWDSGSVIATDTETLMPTQAGTQYPGSTWKKYLPHRLKRTSCSRCRRKMKSGMLIFS